MTRASGLGPRASGALVFVFAACGHPHDGGQTSDPDAALAGSDGSASADAATTGGEPKPIPLTACGTAVEQDIALPTALDFDSFGSFQNPPLLLAKQLLTETSLPVTEIALASGFGSLRRFNSAFRDGCGMPPDVERRAFDPFFTTRRHDGASGLGLHIVHSIVVDRLGGQLQLESKPGAGTVLRVGGQQPWHQQARPFASNW